MFEYSRIGKVDDEYIAYNIALLCVDVRYMADLQTCTSDCCREEHSGLS